MMGQTTSSMSSSPEHILYDFERDITVTRHQRFKHPSAAFFHIIFKLSSIVTYLFGGLFGQDFLSIFVLLILLISMDFWTVKNVTGRLLVGLRWWNHVDDDGNSHWLFENKHNKDNNGEDSLKGLNQLTDNTADSTIFWTALIIAPLLWFILLLVTIFRLNIQWFMVVSLALVLSSSNLYGYIRCKLGGNFKSVLTQYVGKQIFYNFMSSSNQKTTQNTSPYPSA
ncbi:Golgi apparatus membrane protein TVP23 homolog B-like [Oppia nitens]|uniref:Golgi apparatus membrane protein TVP23 homolog B-like n=1 Tax=Oppia nitens TaxID=1686743 RepID=UPI0023D984BC|nr:Golgi apparatus membrane protein TVP23 homolog B-like [Oppia nitens]